MTLKDCFRADLANIFFNNRELGRLHVLNGVILPSTERRWTGRLTNRQSEDYDGVHGEQVTLMFRAEDFCRKTYRLPKEKERVRLDGAWYDVMRSSEEYGCCRLELASQRGRYA